MTDSSVLLPQPDAPRMQTNSPPGTFSETWSRASSAPSPVPYALEISSIRTAGAVVDSGFLRRHTHEPLTAGSPLAFRTSFSGPRS